MSIADAEPFDIVEVSFKNGARKDFYANPQHTGAITGDQVVVESSAGLDLGRITLSGELVRMQMRKKKATEKDVVHAVIRRANERDLERLDEARQLEMPTMVRARAIARSLKLNMKIGDVEYQGDRRKATFYYTADGRVDFRELIRHYAKEFRVKVEMRQIGARQESARIGGLGSCGRELCCSTWLTDFKSVTTAAARYQNLAINQAKLSGMCGRLKCCLNFELDTYLDALKQFPRNADKLRTEAGVAVLVKTDIFKGLMYYAYQREDRRGQLYTLEAKRASEIKEMNKRGETPPDLAGFQLAPVFEVEEDMGYGDVTGAVELPPEQQRSKQEGKRSRRQKPSSGKRRSNDKAKAEAPKAKGRKPEGGSKVGSEKAPKAKGPKPERDPQSGSEKAPKRKSRRNNRRRKPNKDKE